ncbi:DUF995 domain-containing protein [Ensifer sp.]|uniref:DUF995 domain-containing protein n=1 Tax=Ensifer sp. TaxID=1872086 RepID=UPI002E14CC55|nr:DUF995 domain-containing protein [Ensifer sp.]
MKVIVLPLLLPLAAAAFYLGAQPVKAKIEIKPTPLSAYEVYSLYRNKTWNWPTGGARFTAHDRKLVAYVNKGKGDRSYAEGNWYVSDLGMMCMQARWTSSQGSGPARTCFGHSRIGDTIYQRRVPDGKWYVFKHPKMKKYDEYKKFVSNDAITAKALRLKEEFLAKK